MGVWARLRLPNGELADVHPGSIIGRLASARVQLNDPRVSEIHALISLRGRTLKILSQRGLIKVNGTSCAEAVLHPGQQLTLVPGVELSVLDVSLPAQVLVLELSGASPMELSAPVYSLRAGRLIASYLPGAAMYLWSDEVGWSVELPGEPVRQVREGDSWSIGEQTMTLRTVPLQQVATVNTRSTGRIHRPMTLIVRYETVHIRREGMEPVIIVGIPAQIISELAEFRAPTPWHLIADQIWKSDSSESRKRQNWDRTMRRMRAKLREAGLPVGLVAADGRGNVELVLRSQDVLIDES